MVNINTLFIILSMRGWLGSCERRGRGGARAKPAHRSYRDPARRPAATPGCHHCVLVVVLRRADALVLSCSPRCRRGGRRARGGGGGRARAWRRITIRPPTTSA